MAESETEVQTEESKIIEEGGEPFDVIIVGAGAAGVGYFILRQKGFGFGTSHLLVGLPMFAVGGAAAAFFLVTK